MNQKQSELKENYTKMLAKLLKAKDFFKKIWKQPEKMNIEKLKVKEQEKDIMQMLIKWKLKWLYWQ